MAASRFVEAARVVARVVGHAGGARERERVVLDAGAAAGARRGSTCNSCAAMSMIRSMAAVASGRPAPRNAPTGAVVWREDRQRPPAARQRYGPAIIESVAFGTSAPTIGYAPASASMSAHSPRRGAPRSSRATVTCWQLTATVGHRQQVLGARLHPEHRRADAACDGGHDDGLGRTVRTCRRIRHRPPGARAPDERRLEAE